MRLSLYPGMALEARVKPKAGLSIPGQDDPSLPNQKSSYDEISEVRTEV
jgi:hypothetical protein